MAITLTKTPTKTITAAEKSTFNAIYNPIIYQFTFTGIPSGSTSLKAEIRVLDRTGTLIDTREGYASTADIAEIDIQDVLKTMITEESVYAEQAQHDDPSLFVEYSIQYRESYYDDGGVQHTTEWETDDVHYYGVRAVFQIAQSPNFYGNNDKLLCFLDLAAHLFSSGFLLSEFNESKRIPVWPGYPRDITIAVPPFSDNMKFVRALDAVETETDIIQDGTYPGMVTRAQIGTTPGHSYNWDSIYLKSALLGTKCSQTYLLIQKTAGNNPVYIRWRNRKGGFDYWMFEKRQTYKTGVADTKKTGLNISDFENARATHRVYSRKGAKVMICGATNLNEQEYNALDTIQYSNKIEIYLGPGTKVSSKDWMQIDIDEGENSVMTDKPAGEIEYTFVFPEIQIAY